MAILGGGLRRVCPENEQDVNSHKPWMPENNCSHFATCVQQMEICLQLYLADISISLCFLSRFKSNFCEQHAQINETLSIFNFCRHMFSPFRLTANRCREKEKLLFGKLKLFKSPGGCSLIGHLPVCTVIWLPGCFIRIERQGGRAGISPILPTQV